jgi:hypothetical protein
MPWYFEILFGVIIIPLIIIVIVTLSLYFVISLGYIGMFIENIIDYLPFLSKRIFSELEEIR